MSRFHLHTNFTIFTIHTTHLSLILYFIIYIIVDKRKTSITLTTVYILVLSTVFLQSFTVYSILTLLCLTFMARHSAIQCVKSIDCSLITNVQALQPDATKQFSQMHAFKYKPIIIQSSCCCNMFKLILAFD